MLVGDGWREYIEAWMFHIGVLRAEGAVVLLYLEGLILFTFGSKGRDGSRRRRYLYEDELYSSTTCVTFKVEVL